MRDLVAEYIAKSGDDAAKVMEEIDDARRDPRSFLYSSPNGFAVARMGKSVCVVVMAFGNWTEELHDPLVAAATAAGCDRMQWVSRRAGMERGIKMRGLPIEVVGQVFEERI